MPFFLGLVSVISIGFAESINVPESVYSLSKGIFDQIAQLGRWLPHRRKGNLDHGQQQFGDSKRSVNRFRGVGPLFSRWCY